jgi:hypothetical protein
VLTDAQFSISFRKYTPSTNEFSPFYSWDAEMALGFTAVRHGSDSVGASALIQTVGTRNVGNRVSVGATGYNLGFEYVHAIRRTRLATGYRHLSAHLTRDLTDKEDEVKRLGGNVPAVYDPSQFNVVYISGSTTVSQLPFTPEILVAVAPIAFRFNHSPRATSGGSSLRRSGPSGKGATAGSRWALSTSGDRTASSVTQSSSTRRDGTGAEVGCRRFFRLHLDTSSTSVRTSARSWMEPRWRCG